MLSFKQLNEVELNDITKGEHDYSAPSEYTLKSKGFVKSKYKSHSPDHEIYVSHSNHHKYEGKLHYDKDMVWVNKKTKTPELRISGRAFLSKHSPDEEFLSGIYTRRIEGSSKDTQHQSFAHHAYMDMWTGRASHPSGPARGVVSEHDSMSKGAIKLKNKIVKHPTYGKKVVYHSFDHKTGEGKQHLSGSFYKPMSTPPSFSRKAESKAIVAFVPRKFRVKEKK